LRFELEATRGRKLPNEGPEWAARRARITPVVVPAQGWANVTDLAQSWAAPRLTWPRRPRPARSPGASDLSRSDVFGGL
jgi:hypothetical protein